MTLNLWQHGPQIVERFLSHGPSAAVYPNLWDSSLQLATLAQSWGGLQARDFSGKGNHGTLEGGPTWGYGTYRGGAFRAVGFDGSNGVVSGFDDGAKLSFIQNTGVFTLSVCVQFNGLGTVTGTIISNTPTRTSDKGFRFAVISTGVIRAAATRGAGGGNVVWNFDTPDTIDAGWHHIAAVGNSSTVSVYIDGAFSASGAIGTLSSGDATRAANIGRNGEGEAEAPQYWPGQIADARIYSRALSPAEICQLAQHPLAAYETRQRKYWFFPTGLADPFAIDNSGVITIADVTQLVIGDTWEVEIEVTDSDANTSRDTFLIQLLSALELQGTATLAITASGSLGFTQRVEGAATLAIDATATISIDALLAATAELQIGATGSLTFLVGLAGTPTLDVDASGSLTALVSLAGEAELVIDASGVLEGLIYVGASPCRLVNVDAETRIITVDAENRIVEVECQ